MNYALVFRPEVDRTSLLMLGEGDRSHQHLQPDDRISLSQHWFPNNDLHVAQATNL
jgi:hypothetical protein